LFHRQRDSLNYSSDKLLVFLKQNLYCSEHEKALINLQSGKKDASANQIKKEIYSSGKNLTFFELAQEHLDELESSEKLNRLSTDSALVSYLVKFHKSKQLLFQEIVSRELFPFGTDKIRIQFPETTKIRIKYF
jgi:hypothetical protein